MTEKEIRSLKRIDLLHILEEQKKELERVNNSIDRMRSDLEKEELIMEDPGDIMKSALQINDIFRSAQKETQHTLDQLKSMEEKQNQALQSKENAILRWSEMKQKETNEMCASMLEETKLKCNSFEKETKEKCDVMEKSARIEVEKRWKEISERLEAFYEAHRELKELMDATDERQK